MLDGVVVVVLSLSSSDAEPRKFLNLSMYTRSTSGTDDVVDDDVGVDVDVLGDGFVDFLFLDVEAVAVFVVVAASAADVFAPFSPPAAVVSVLAVSSLFLLDELKLLARVVIVIALLLHT